MFGRVAVAGHSMAPALRDGDWVIVVPLVRPPRVGQIVLARDPRTPERLVLKRVTEVQGASCTLLGDRPDESTDSRTFGPVARSLILGRAVFRYVPLARAGFL